MKSLQNQYNLIKEGKGSKDVFTKAAKSQYPNVVPNNYNYEQTVDMLKQRSIINEGFANMNGLVGVQPLQDPDWFSIFKESTDKGPAANLKTADKSVTDKETAGYDYKDKKNPSNMNFEEYLKGYYDEMKDPKNAGKTEDEIKKIVEKNLTKNSQHYVEKGQFGVKDLGYEKSKEDKEATGKYKSSGMLSVKLNESKYGEDPIRESDPYGVGGSEHEDDWREGARGIQKEDDETVETDPSYTHYAVRKSDNKIVTGWDYKGLEPEDIKYYCKMDLKDDFPENKPSDFVILGKNTLLKRGLDPTKRSSWWNPTYEDVVPGKNVQHVGKDWRVRSGKSGKLWPAHYKSKKSAEAGLRGYQANKEGLNETEPEEYDDMDRKNRTETIDSFFQEIELNGEFYNVEAEVTYDPREDEAEVTKIHSVEKYNEDTEDYEPIDASFNLPMDKLMQAIESSYAFRARLFETNKPEMTYEEKWKQFMKEDTSRTVDQVIFDLLDQYDMLDYADDIFIRIDYRVVVMDMHALEHYLGSEYRQFLQGIKQAGKDVGIDSNQEHDWIIATEPTDKNKFSNKRPDQPHRNSGDGPQPKAAIHEDLHVGPGDFVRNSFGDQQVFRVVNHAKDGKITVETKQGKQHKLPANHVHLVTDKHEIDKWFPDMTDEFESEEESGIPANLSELNKRLQEKIDAILLSKLK